MRELVDIDSKIKRLTWRITSFFQLSLPFTLGSSITAEGALYISRSVHCKDSKAEQNGISHLLQVSILILKVPHYFFIYSIFDKTKSPNNSSQRWHRRIIPIATMYLTAEVLQNAQCCSSFAAQLTLFQTAASFKEISRPRLQWNAYQHRFLCWDGT